MTTTDHRTEYRQHIDGIAENIARALTDGGSFDADELMEMIAEEAVGAHLRHLVADGRAIHVPAVEGPHGTHRLELFVPVDVATSADEFDRRVALAVDSGAVTRGGAVELATGLCAYEGGPTDDDRTVYAAALRAEGLEPPRLRHGTHCGCDPEDIA